MRLHRTDVQLGTSARLITHPEAPRNGPHIMVAAAAGWSVRRSSPMVVDHVAGPPSDPDEQGAAPIDQSVRARGAGLVISHDGRGGREGRVRERPGSESDPRS